MRLRCDLEPDHPAERITVVGPPVGKPIRSVGVRNSWPEPCAALPRVWVAFGVWGLGSPLPHPHCGTDFASECDAKTLATDLSGHLLSGTGAAFWLAFKRR